MLAIKLSVITSILLVSTTQAIAAPDNGKYVLDAAHSNVYFSVDHLGYADISGRFNHIEGAVNINPQGEAQIDVNIQAASVDTNHTKRDDHLRSPDFFNAKQFPVIRFSGKLMTQTTQNTLTGSLTLLGQTKAVDFVLEQGKDGKDPWGLQRVGYTAKTTIKRSDFGMQFMQGGVGNDVTLVINVEAIKQ